jgi:hypothetical protein
MEVAHGSVIGHLVVLLKSRKTSVQLNEPDGNPGQFIRDEQNTHHHHHISANARQPGSVFGKFADRPESEPKEEKRHGKTENVHQNEGYAGGTFIGCQDENACQDGTDARGPTGCKADTDQNRGEIARLATPILPLSLTQHPVRRNQSGKHQAHHENDDAATDANGFAIVDKKPTEQSRREPESEKNNRKPNNEKERVTKGTHAVAETVS